MGEKENGYILNFLSEAEQLCHFYRYLFLVAKDSLIREANVVPVTNTRHKGVGGNA